MKKVVLILLALVIVYLMSSCSSPKVNYVVSIDYQPKDVSAGDLITISLDVAPRPFAQIGSMGVIEVNDKKYQSSLVPFKKQIRVPEGTVNIKGEFIFNGEVFESATTTLNVKKLSDEYSVYLQVPNDTLLGTDVSIKATVVPTPDFNDWSIYIYVDGERACNLVPEDKSFEKGCEVDLPAGDHKIQAVMKSPYGEVKSPEKKLRILDTTPPEIDDVGILPSTPVADEPIYFFAKFKEDESGAQVEIYRDGELSGQSKPLGNIAFFSLGDLDPGKHEITVIAKNVSDYASTKKYTFTVLRHDKKPPSVLIKMPKYVFSTSESVYSKIDMSDDGGIVKYTVFLDGKEYTTEEVDMMTELERNFDFGKMSNGLHSISVEAYDRIGRSGSDRVNFFVSDSIVDVVLSIDPPQPEASQVARFQIALGVPLSDVESLDLIVDKDTVYSYTAGGTETLKPYIEWRATPGRHRATVYIKTADNKYGIGVLEFAVKDMEPPQVVTMYVNGTELSRDPYNPAILKVGAHRVRVFVKDDGGLPKDNVIKLDVYDMDGTTVYLQTLVLAQDAISQDMREATYTITLNFPIGKYKLVPKDIEDVAGNILESAEPFYMKVLF